MRDPAPSPPRPPTPLRQWAMAAAGLIMIAAAAAVVLHQRAPSPPPPHLVRAVDESSIALYVQHDGPALRLHWNPDAAPIRAAVAGVLSISDGPRQSRLDLNAQDLRSGVASYWPESREVTFGLELDGDAAGTIRASADAPSEDRPSPFEPKAKAATPRASKRALLESEEDAEDDPPSFQPADRDVEEPTTPKHSRWRRVVRKIPLLRRLHRH